MTVYGPSVAVVSAEGSLLADVSVEWGRKAEDNWTFRRLCLPPAEFLEGRTLVLASTGGNTYFHWLTDVLPRAQLAAKAGYKSTGFDHILVNGIHAPFQKETLAHLKVPLAVCRPLPSHEKAFRLKKAVLPSLPGLPGVVPPETVEFLRRAFPARAKFTRKRIFVGRKGARHRPCAEEGRIVRELRKKGFVPVECEKLSVREQARIFASAEMVVGAHGAGLTNLVFCRPGTKVIELFGPGYVNPCYRDLCVAAGLEHMAVIGNGRDWGVSLRHDRPSAPITASWELVEEALGKLKC